MQNTPQINTILFDIGNVILHFDYLRAARKFAEKTGLPLDTIDKHFYFSDWERQYSKGKCSSEEFFGKLKKDLQLKMEFQEFAGIWNDIFWLNHSIEEVIKALKGRFTLACLTNTTDLHFRYWLESFPVFANIDKFFPSHELGLRKPDPEIFKAVLSRLGIRPEQLVFIDDMEENARAAADLGIHGIHYKTTDELVKSFKNLGIDLNHRSSSKVS